ncbi:sulfatase [Thalassoglobus sp. JC818]|uniref:sulfatase n=1 Tax=Thalassoglobus sp. JC818 TaxID=3232136 RepID=UPI003458CE04
MKQLALAVLFSLSFPLVNGSLCAQVESKSNLGKPNVLFIAIDDLRTSLGCYGDPLAQSLNIDQFAQTARLFNRAYVQQAVCGPSRTSLLTGLLPDHTQVWHNRNLFRETHPNHVTLPQLFKQNGYRTLAFGKIFSGNQKELDPVSWSEPELLNQKGWKKHLLPENQSGEKKQAAYEAPDVADDAYPDGKIANLAVETLENLKQAEQPFFLAVGFYKPHLPFNAPKKYWDLHEATNFDLPESVTEPTKASPELALHTHRELGGYKAIPKDEQLNRQQTRRLRHGYYACVSYTDTQVGKVLKALERLKLDENTIVVIWGDHGFSLGETNRWCKATNFELDTRVPLLIRVPNLNQPGVATDSLVETVDLYPTLASMAGLTTPENLDGRSFVPILEDPKAPGRDVVMSQFNRPWESTTPEVMGYSIRTKNARYTRWINWQSRETVAEELYDYSAPDSAQMHAGLLIERQNFSSSQPRLLKQLSDQMDAVLASRLKLQSN